MRKFKFGILFIIFLGVIYCNPGNVDYQENIQINQVTDKNYGDVAQLLKDTFRIDIKKIMVDMEYFPELFYVICEAEVTFTMFSDNTKPIIHLKPAILDKGLINSIELDGQSLDINNDSDVTIINIDGSTQRVLEFQRVLDTGVDHILKISYRKNLSKNYYMFTTQVSDIDGQGNETIFPTINRPGELADHHLRFRVNSQIHFRMIGSGFVQKIDNPSQQEWTLDTEREVASYTIMFVLLPLNDTLYQEQTIDGVDVRIMVYQNGASIDNAFRTLQTWLPELKANIGPFPMKRGLSILLMDSGGGMEYYGGTISSLWALKHEIFHMYYACSTVFATYRDSWLDEAITSWYADSKSQSFSPISETFTSTMVSGRSPIGIGFDARAYNEGSQMIQHIAVNIGGRQAMVDFLSYIHQNYSFKPFTTLEFVDYLKDYSGLDYRQHFDNWLFYGENTDGGVNNSAEYIERHRVDLTPPKNIRDKYKNLETE